MGLDGLLRTVSVAVVLLFTSAFVGCSIAPHVSDRSYEEQQEWLEQQLEEVISVVGVSEGWQELLGKASWETERDLIMTERSRRGCFENNQRLANRLTLDLANFDLENPVAKVVLVGEYLEKQGWTVRVIADHRELDPPYLSIVADHPDGYGAEVGGAVGFTVGFTTECSNHESMMRSNSFKPLKQIEQEDVQQEEAQQEEAEK